MLEFPTTVAGVRYGVIGFRFYEVADRQLGSSNFSGGSFAGGAPVPSPFLFRAALKFLQRWAE